MKIQTEGTLPKTRSQVAFLVGFFISQEYTKYEAKHRQKVSKLSW